VTRAHAFAKINLAHVVGSLRPDGRHEVASVLQRIDLHDVVELELSDGVETIVEGFADDTVVRASLDALGRATGSAGAWRVRIEKRIPVAAGLGGGSSDAAAALFLANALAPTPLTEADLRAVAASIGADVPFFLSPGTQLATGYGEQLAPLSLPDAYVVLLVLPRDEHKTSTADVYGTFDDRSGEQGFEARRAELMAALGRIDSARDLSALPRNDLASSPVARKLIDLGAFRADVTGAGPAIYGLFEREEEAWRAGSEFASVERKWVARPVTGR
jgi:4-diphosphocytidyl-2-C-methyl-D-erythritol kinase